MYYAFHVLVKSTQQHLLDLLTLFILMDNPLHIDTISTELLILYLLFDFILYLPVNKFSVMLGRVFLG